MTKELKKAWKLTFKKWENIITNDSYELCGLCLWADINCDNCPIKKITKSKNCKHSPYWEWKGNPTIANAELEYMFLLFVYEATK